MSFSVRGLSVLCYCNQFTLWHYSSDDTMTEILTPGYLNPAKAMLRAGDHMHIERPGLGALRWVRVDADGHVMLQELT